jgi:hypothetical protein
MSGKWQVNKENVLATPTPAHVRLSEAIDPVQEVLSRPQDAAVDTAPDSRFVDKDMSRTSTPGMGRLELSDVADNSMMSAALDVDSLRMPESRPTSAKRPPRRVRPQSSAPHQPALALEDNPLYKEFMRFSQGTAYICICMYVCVQDMYACVQDVCYIYVFSQGTAYICIYVYACVQDMCYIYVFSQGTASSACILSYMQHVYMCIVVYVGFGVEGGGFGV